MTTQLIQNYKYELESIAGQIKAKTIQIESRRQDETAIDEELHEIKSAAQTAIGTEKNEAGRLRYTNDDQRKSALAIALKANADYQALKSARSVKILERVLLESDLEFHRKSFRALELQTLFHANNPAA